MSGYEAVIGLEIHAQLKTKSKLFCSCSVEFGAKANEHTCELCVGFPGALPRLNKKAVELAVKAGLALNCNINETSIFARKNYFYPDLPNGFQTSQYEPPICEKGFLDISVNNNNKRIGITRIHLEDDAGKCIHGQNGMTWVDLNRAGTGLIEIVSEPDIRTAEEAAAYMREVHAILVNIDATDGNMEEGNFRCDANVSIRPKGSDKLGTRAEIKNLNSFRNIQKAIEVEISRQIACLEDGEKLVQETRLFDSVKQVTVSMRTKEDAEDYRYFPNPDVPPVRVSKEQIELWKNQLPELPTPKKQRFIEQYGLSEDESAVFVADKDIANYFEEAAKFCSNYRQIANILNSMFLRECSANNIKPSSSKMTPKLLAELASIIDSGMISLRIAGDLFAELFSSGVSPKELAKSKGMIQISDSSELESLIDTVIKDNPGEVQEFKSGKTKLMAFFVGQIMKKTQGKANPELVSKILTKKLSE